MNIVLKWKLKGYLDKRGITGYRLMVESGVSGNTIYRITNNRTDGVQGKVLNDILNALHRLTGETVTPNDLLEFTPDKERSSHA